MCSILGPWIAKRRAPKVSAKYAEIGGGSPILEWSRKQGSALVQLLNERRKESSPHHYYVGFRYAPPLLESALEQMKRYFSHVSGLNNDHFSPLTSHVTILLLMVGMATTLNSSSFLCLLFDHQLINEYSGVNSRY